MKEITLTQGKVTLVDDMDYERLNKFKWSVMKNGKTFYAQRNIKDTNGKYRTLLMHRDILFGDEIDHIDHNGLNNQRANLRVVTHLKNCMNRRDSKCPGIHWHKRDKKWHVRRQVGGVRKHLGSFDTKEDAIHALVSC